MLEKVTGGMVIGEYTDREGNTHITHFGVLDFCSGCDNCFTPVRWMPSVSAATVQQSMKKDASAATNVSITVL